MLTVTRDVYYCEHCKRHRLTKRAIEWHEQRCIYNPQRVKCGWHGNAAFVPPPAAVGAALLRSRIDAGEGGDVVWLREQQDGCPACMLAVVVQAGLTTYEHEDLDFDYQREVERFRDEERRGEQFAW